MARVARLLLVSLVSGLSAAACSDPGPPPNVVLVTVDTLRADRLSPYGYTGTATPALARFAGESIVFERAYADTSWTLPSLTSVMTGRYPSEHRVRRWTDSLADSATTLAELLQSRGYRTAAIVGSYPLDRSFGLAQGFDHYDDEMTISMLDGDAAGSVPQAPEGVSAEAARQYWRLDREANDAYRPDRVVTDRGIAWLHESPDRPYFLWLHYFGPHEKGERRDLVGDARREHVRRQIARYDGDVAATDVQVGRFLDALRSAPDYDRTAVIFHSDHGQSLEEHGMFGHGLDLFEATVHVPLMVRLPSGRRAGQRVERLVRNLDIFTTIARLGGAPVADGTAGQDLLQDLHAEGDAAINHAYMESHHPLAFTVRSIDVDGTPRRVGSVLRGVRTQDSKLIVHQPMLAVSEDPSPPLPPELVARESRSAVYDLARDPGEANDKAGASGVSAAALAELLARYDDGARAASPSSRVLDESARERLRNLGYEP